jgi:hypothetical protein
LWYTSEQEITQLIPSPFHVEDVWTITLPDGLEINCSEDFELRDDPDYYMSYYDLEPEKNLTCDFKGHEVVNGEIYFDEQSEAVVLFSRLESYENDSQEGMEMKCYYFAMDEEFTEFYHSYCDLNTWKKDEEEYIVDLYWECVD